MEIKEIGNDEYVCLSLFSVSSSTERKLTYTVDQWDNGIIIQSERERNECYQINK